MKRNLFQIVATPALIVCVLMGAPLTRAQGSSQADNDACSLRSLRGSYGFVLEGAILSAPGVTIPVRAIAMVEFDGKGQLTVVDHFVVNGQAPASEWSPGTGTYTVNGNCTGTMEIVKPGLPNAVNKIVIVRGGKEIRSVLVKDAVTGIGTKTE
jgi:hypothetical protein